MGDFRAALNNEKETYAIYKQQLGEDHEKTKESSDCLRHLTQQAVVLQKKMNEIYTGKSGVSLPPIQVQPPSMGSVLDMLNVINGILFVQISQQDIENFKAEIEKRQKELTPDGEIKAFQNGNKKNEKENKKEEKDNNKKEEKENKKNEKESKKEDKENKKDEKENKKIEKKAEAQKELNKLEENKTVLEPIVAES